MKWKINVISRQYHRLKLDEKFNFVTHFAGLVSVILITPLLIYYAHSDEQSIAFMIYSLGAGFMFMSSSFYHLAIDPQKKEVWQLLDYISIFVLIGCSYTAFIYLYLNTKLGHIFLIFHWFIIILGIAFRILEKEKYKSISLTLYIFLGWMVILIFNDITANMPYIVKVLLVVGGLFYTIGVYFFIDRKMRLSHAIWHIFVLLGVASHYLSLYYS
jgi:hemolysin III